MDDPYLWATRRMPAICVRADGARRGASIYDLRFIDGMVQHHTGASRVVCMCMSSVVRVRVSSCSACVWSLVIRSGAIRPQRSGMLSGAKGAWYPARLYRWRSSGGDPNSLAGLPRMSQAQIDGAMRMMAMGHAKENRGGVFLEKNAPSPRRWRARDHWAHDGSARRSTNPTILAFAANHGR